MQSVPIHRILFAKSEKIIACYANKFLILNSKSGEILALPEHTISKFTNAIEIKFKEDSFIRDVAVSNSAIATISEDKSLDIYDLKTLNLLKSATTPKRANIVSISRDSNNVIVGDKFGDVVSLNLKENAEMKLLLGHISQLFDIEMSIDGKYLITADRDEKIRVSCYPLTYQIENFCLGHTDFISKIHIPILNSDLLLSGGGDSYIALWKFEQGLEIDRFDTLKYVGDSELPCCVMDIKSSPVSKMIALAFEKKSVVVLLKIVDEKLVLAQELSVKKDVLSVCFDQDGNLWISYGLVSFQELNNLVDVSRFDESTSSYLPFNHDDELTMHVNQVANISIPVLPEYYEIGMHSKAAIQKKISEKPRGKKVVEEESEEENHEAKKQKH